VSECAPVYEFREQADLGEAAAAELDAFFGATYEIRHTTLSVDKVGIDRVFTHRATGKRYSVEYKGDSRAAVTGNAFIEVVSVSTSDAPGWAKTCLAQWIVYYIPPLRSGYWLRAVDIKARLEEWERRYRVASCQNKSYVSLGILVPLRTIGATAYKQFSIPVLSDAA
jgi:hypothetical protein